MRDFDVVRAESREHGDRRFKIGGREFRFKAYSSPELYARTWTANSDLEWLEAADAFILSVLEPSCVDDWHAVRATDAAEPLSFTDVRDVLDYVLEVTSGRPTDRPNGYSDTPSVPGTKSTVTSPLPAEAASAATT